MSEMYGIILVDQLDEHQYQYIWPLAEKGSFQFLNTVASLNDLVRDNTFDKGEYLAILCDKTPYARTYKIVSRFSTQERKGAIYKLTKKSS